MPSYSLHPSKIMRISTVIHFVFWTGILLAQLPLLGDIRGKSRDEVIAAFGQPSSALNSSNREILNYPQGKIVLTGGTVSSFRGTFNSDDTPTPSVSPTTTVTTPKSAPQAPQVTPQPTTSQPAERRSIQPFRWSHTLAEAQARSVKENRPILALFTGPDWCGPCQQLEAEVLNTSNFKRLGRKKYIPLKIALYRNTYQSAQAKAEYNRLSSEYNISVVPSFVILDAEGNLTAKPDLFKNRKGVTNFEEQVFAAIEEAENGGSGMGLYTKIGIGVALAGGAFMFLRR